MIDLSKDNEYEKLKKELKDVKRQLTIKPDCSTIHHQRNSFRYKQYSRM